MIHYSCDRCRKSIDPNCEVRYVVKVEVHAAIEPVELDEGDEDRDYLAEIQDILERIEDSDDAELSADDGYSRRTYDLCPECHRKFMQNPMGCDMHAHIGFSSN